MNRCILWLLVGLLTSCSFAKKSSETKSISNDIKVLKIDKGFEEVYEASVAFLSDKTVISNDRENGRILTTFSPVAESKQLRQIRIHIFQKYMENNSVTVLIAIRDIEQIDFKAGYDPIQEWGHDKDFEYFTEDNKYTPKGFTNTSVPIEVFERIETYLKSYKG